MRDLTGTTAFVTGASRGIGRAIAIALAAHGARVGITGRDEAALAESAAAVQAAAPGDEPIVVGAIADVRDPSALEAAVGATVARFGGLDLVVANAGVGGFAPIQDLSSETWHTVLDTNLSGVFNTVKATLPSLTERRGLLVTIGSLAGTNAFAGGAAYVASKHALVGFTHAVMLDLRPLGVRVSTVMPGSVATRFGGRDPRPEDDWKLHDDDVAEAVLYLARCDERALPSKIELRPARTGRT